MAGLLSILIYIIDTVGKLYIAAVLLRFLLQMAHANFYNPISQFIVKITHPLLRPVRRVIPNIGKQDFASIVLAFLLTIVLYIVEFTLIGLITQKNVVLAILLNSFFGFINIFFYIIYGILLGCVILSWIAPDSRAPAASLIRELGEFILAPIRRIIPPIGIFDISPMVALLLLAIIDKGLFALVAYII